MIIILTVWKSKLFAGIPWPPERSVCASEFQNKSQESCKFSRQLDDATDAE